MRAVLSAAVAALSAFLIPAAMAQQVVIDMAGMKVKHDLDQARNSSDNPFGGSDRTIGAFGGYSYDINCMVRGTSGLFAVLFSDPTPLGEVLDFFAAGQSRVLKGVVRNEGGTLPCIQINQVFDGSAELLGEVKLTFLVRVDAGGVGYIEIKDVTFPAGGFFLGQGEVTSGTTTIARWTPTAPAETEWHFGGVLDPVAASTGKAGLRYADDPAFGPPLRGESPDGSLPTGITDAQSSFGATASYGIAGVGGKDDTVYSTSPTRNASSPGDPDLSRPIGVAFWPNTRAEVPDEKVGQWTAIWDLYIPSSSWGVEWPVALLQTSDTNANDADAFIQRDGSGVAGVGFKRQPGDYLRTDKIKPDTWMRLALVCNGTQTNTSEVYIDGVHAGTTGGDWIYNTTDRAEPKYGDGTAVSDDDWSEWGMFPSPWALSGGTSGTGMGATTGLFQDDTGEGESVYLANFYFADRLLGAAEIAALGGPDAAGIKFKEGTACKPDCNKDGRLNINDFICMQAKWRSRDAYGDYDGSGTYTVNDFIRFQADFVKGCS